MRTFTLDQYAKEVLRMPEQFEAACLRALREAAAAGVGTVVVEISKADAVNTGDLRQSVRAWPISAGAVIAVEAPHAPFIEYGTRPHWPPREPIKAWVMRKLRPPTEEEADAITFAICAKISQTGIEPRGFFRKAMKQILAGLDGFIRAELRKIQ